LNLSVPFSGLQITFGLFCQAELFPQSGKGLAQSKGAARGRLRPPDMNLDAAIGSTKSMKIKDLELVGGSTCLHSLGEEAGQFSVPFFSCTFMSFMLHGDFSWFSQFQLRDLG